jgi:hypothetical protein
MMKQIHRCENEPWYSYQVHKQPTAGEEGGIWFACREHAIEVNEDNMTSFGIILDIGHAHRAAADIHERDYRCDHYIETDIPPCPFCGHLPKIEGEYTWCDTKGCWLAKHKATLEEWCTRGLA